MSALAERVMDTSTYGNPEVLAALFFIVVLTEVGVPFPLVIDGVLFTLGYRFAQLWPYSIAVVSLLLLGRESGAAAVYWVFRTVGGPLVKRIWQHLPFLRRRVDRASGKIRENTALGAMLARLSTQSVTALAGFLPDFGIRASYEVALSRVTPGLLTLTSAASGTFGVRYRYFGLGVGIASVLVDGTEITLGIIMGYGLSRFGITRGTWLIGVGAVVNFLIIWLGSRMLWRHRREAEPGYGGLKTNSASRT